MKKSRQITAVAPWFGSNRTLAENVGRALEGCAWVGVPFAGGMCELAHINARTLLKGPRGTAVIRFLRRMPYHQSVLESAQYLLNNAEKCPIDDETRAVAYFACAWMSRNGTAGTDGELRSGLSHRWEAGGGDSATRFRSATKALVEWRRIFQRCTFVTLDVFDFMKKVKDVAGNGVYLDPPFPGAGDAYRHKFSDRQHAELAETLVRFERCSIVVRFYDHPLIQKLYPESDWTWNHFAGRKSTNDIGPEVLLTRRSA